ncbi:MAG: YwqG family protein [Phenylobacterium sp.]
MTRLLAGILGGPRRAKGAAPILELMETQALPCVILQAGIGTPVGKLGGRPDLNSRHDWPLWKGEPQSFLAQLDLAALRRTGGPDWLPERGALFFFYDAEQSTWGFDSADRGSWMVIHDPDGFAAAPRVLPVLPANAAYRERLLGGSPERSRPDAELMDVRFPDVDTPEYEAYEARLNASAPKDAPWHQVGGYPAAIQTSAMALDCQLASNGVYLGGPEGYASSRRKVLEAGAKDWQLLLQVDSDDDAGMMWGDVGMLYFWVREEDARRGDFAGVWMVLQCS